MKPVTSNAPGLLLMLIFGSAIQGCSQGGDDTVSSSAETAAAKSSQNTSLAPAAAQAVGIGLVLFPTSAPPGSAIAAMGAGFQDHCGIALLLDGQGEPLATAEVGDDGTYSTQFIVPEATEQGEHAVLAQGLTFAGQVCDEPTPTTSEASLTVTGRVPVITLETSEGRPGASVEVHGRGFCGDAMCSAVTILLDGQVGAADAMVDADGTFIADAFVPAISAAGPIAVVAIQTDADGGELRAFGELVVTVRPNRPSTGPEIE